MQTTKFFKKSRRLAAKQKLDCELIAASTPEYGELLLMHGVMKCS